ncbi:hypothetical protein TrLO_g11518 [Triparma laevis f. longispina]|uniref:Uncharacterized protein n=1 Tax=Triparma laevis f. longispina TaxID=1714387 RepID=A0A9W7F5J9_9STRA|nr:hypothetical protein TrLO_g11518 [Triparma laevis f. longispina]
MLFFSSETIACLISQNSWDNGQCTNTAVAALYLSIFLLVITMMSISSKTVPKSVQKAVAWEMPRIASLNLKRWQQMQGGFVLISAISSLFLLSALGVETSENTVIWLIGVTGLVCVFFAAIVLGVMLIRTNAEHQRVLNVETPQPVKVRPVKAFSSGEMQEGMFIGAVL